MENSFIMRTDAVIAYKSSFGDKVPVLLKLSLEFVLHNIKKDWAPIRSPKSPWLVNGESSKYK